MIIDKATILEAYDKGPDAMVSFVFDLCMHFEKRISELELQAKKTQKIATNNLLRMVYENPPRKVYVKKQDEKQVDNQVTKDVHFTKSRIQITLLFIP
jgi:hypothetical protein